VAKVKATKLTSFFEGYRRKAYLVRYEHLCDRGEYGRFKLQLKLPILNEPAIGINGPVSDVFMLMAKDDSKVERTMLGVMLDGMTTEFFSTGDTAQSKIPTFSSTGVKFTKFALVAGSEGDKREVNLELAVYIPASEQLRDWAYLMIHKEFHLEAVYSQSEMNFSNEPADEDDTDAADDDPAPDDDDPNAPPLPLSVEEVDDGEIPFETPDPADSQTAFTLPDPPRMPHKNGPKVLAAYHSTQKPN
jgi:hypothetical protein